MTVKVAVSFPAATVTEDATVADDELLDSLTAIPPVGATPLRVTVPEEDDPPTKFVGVKVNKTSVGGLIVRVAVLETVPLLAVIVATF